MILFIFTLLANNECVTAIKQLSTIPLRVTLAKDFLNSINSKRNYPKNITEMMINTFAENPYIRTLANIMIDPSFNDEIYSTVVSPKNLAMAILVSQIPKEASPLLSNAFSSNNPEIKLLTIPSISTREIFQDANKIKFFNNFLKYVKTNLINNDSHTLLYADSDIERGLITVFMETNPYFRSWSNISNDSTIPLTIKTNMEVILFPFIIEDALKLWQEIAIYLTEPLGNNLKELLTILENKPNIDNLTQFKIKLAHKIVNDIDIPSNILTSPMITVNLLLKHPYFEFLIDLVNNKTNRFTEDDDAKDIAIIILLYIIKENMLTMLDNFINT